MTTSANVEQALAEFHRTYMALVGHIRSMMSEGGQAGEVRPASPRPMQAIAPRSRIIARSSPNRLLATPQRSPEADRVLQTRHKGRTVWTPEESLDFKNLLLEKRGRSWEYYAGRMGKSVDACKNKYKQLLQVQRDRTRIRSQSANGSHVSHSDSALDSELDNEDGPQDWIGLD
jgi:hypothetical protein